MYVGIYIYLNNYVKNVMSYLRCPENCKKNSYSFPNIVPIINGDFMIFCDISFFLNLLNSNFIKRKNIFLLKHGYLCKYLLGNYE